MAVRVKLKIRTRKGEVGRESISSGLVNSGFESDVPEIILPLALASNLGLYPKLPAGTSIEKYEVAGGGRLDSYSVKDGVEVQVLTDDKVSNPVVTTCIIMAGEKEVLIGDKLISKFAIVIEDAGEGIWHFRGESNRRKSEPPQYWG